MNVFLKLVLTILLFFSLFSLSVAVDDIKCCYTKWQDTNIRWSTTSCSENEIELDSVSDPRDCYSFEEDRACYQSGNNILNSLVSTTNGPSRVYDIQLVLNWLESEISNFNSNSIGPYTSACIEGAVDIGGGTDPGFVYDPNPITGDLDEGYDENFKDTSQYQRDLTFCSDSGGEFGFYSSKNACNNLEKNGEKICLYNPKNAGYFSSKFKNEDILKIEEEISCVPKSGILSCFEYNTRENCQNNLAYDFAKLNTRLLDESCRWVENSLISSSFSNNNGFCIPDTDLDKSYNVFLYSDRGNLVQNPSFEDGNENWGDSCDIIEGGSSYHLLNSCSIDSQRTLEQNFYYLSEGSTYIPSLYFKRLNSNDSSLINIEIIAFDENNSEISRSNPIFYDTFSLGDTFNFFTPLIGNPFTIPENTNYVKFKLSFEGDTLHVDSISFEIIPSGVLTSQRLLFKPIESINSRASYCSLCYDDLNFNFCTEEKSDVLGDCSYMVENHDKPYTSLLESDDYLGTYTNNYSISEPWKSQSLANSLLFCEMYLNEEQCVDSNNYINSKFSQFHVQTMTNQLCKWDSVAGCYKDSDNDNEFDLNGFFENSLYTEQSSPKLRIFSEEFISSSYKRNNEDSKISDFELSCDSLPPTAYIYFDLMDYNNESFLIDSPIALGEFGSGFINFEIKDLPLEACNKFEINPKLFIDYDVNGKSWYKLYENNIRTELAIPIKDFFIDEFDELILEEGINEISLIVKDQSGNIGYDKIFEFDLDLHGPQITLDTTDLSVNENENSIEITSNLPRNYVLDFNAIDRSQIYSCSYNIEPISSLANSNFYSENSSGFFQLEASSNNVDFSLNISQHILNSSPSGDFYNLNITCLDLFNQKTSLNVYFPIDFNTELSLISPKPFEGLFSNTIISKEAFFNKEKELIAISSERFEEISCTIDFDSGESFQANVNNIPEGFTNNLYPGVIFYKNITADISFVGDGMKNGSIKCEDSFVNSIEKPLIYYYDTIEPLVNDYSVNTSNSNTALKLGGKNYIISTLGLNIKADLDGTGSWINNDINSLNLYRDDTSNLISGTVFFPKEYNLSTFESMIEIRNFYDPIVDAGSLIEEDLKELRYKFEYEDIAGNKKNETIIFYHDISTPAYKFGSSSVIRAPSKNLLFSADDDPQFDITFNSPSYRNYTCVVSATQESFTYINSFPKTNNLVFKLSEISSSLDIKSYDKIDINLQCIDDYGLELANIFELKYDSSNPILSDFFLSSGDRKYYPFQENIVFPTLSDNLVYRLNNTDEIGYFCTYKFESNQDYSCNEREFKLDFTSYSEYLNSPELTILGSDFENPICYRTDDFYFNYNEQTLNGDKYSTEIKIYGMCNDYSNRSSKGKTINLVIDYTGSSLLDFRIRNENGDYYPIIDSSQLYEKILISYDKLGNEVLGIADKQIGNASYFTYTSELPLTFSEVTPASFPIWAHAINSENNIIESISLVINYDPNPPIANINHPDMQEENITYYENFLINLKGEDKEGNIDRLELYYGPELIFQINRENEIIYDENLIQFDPSQIYCYADLCSASIIFYKGQINSTYNFRLDVYDLSDNKAQDYLTLNVRDGVYITLLNSSNSFASPLAYSWITKTNSPTIKFETSKQVDYCTIYPFQNNQFAQLYGEAIKLEYLTDGPSSIFQFDLSSVAQSRFDLSILDSKESEIKINCFYNGDFYNYTRDLKLINYLPDYTLESSEGFILPNEPYESLITIKSVGPYRYISCKYNLDGGNWINLNPQIGTIFKQELDFSSYDSEVILNLECVDSLGNKGPLKDYKFIVDKNTDIQLYNLKLQKTSGSYYSNKNNTIYIKEQGQYQLGFDANRKKLQCSFQISSNQGIFSGILNFFRNLFINNRESLDSNDASFEYQKGVEINSNLNRLLINCNNDDLSSKAFEYDIVVNNQDASFEIERIN
jgi:hypothetical protein